MEYVVNIELLELVDVNTCLLLKFPLFWTKVELLKNKFGFDDAFNYKEEPDLNAALKRSAYITSMTYVRCII